MSCKTCKYYSGSTYIGNCRAHPPGLGIGMDKWPKVSPDDYCGDWKDKEQPAWVKEKLKELEKKYPGNWMDLEDSTSPQPSSDKPS